MQSSANSWIKTQTFSTKPHSNQWLFRRLVATHHLVLHGHCKQTRKHIYTQHKQTCSSLFVFVICVTFCLLAFFLPLERIGKCQRTPGENATYVHLKEFDFFIVKFYFFIFSLFIVCGILCRAQGRDGHSWRTAATAAIDKREQERFNRKWRTLFVYRASFQKAGQKSQMAFGHSFAVKATGHHEWSLQGHEKHKYGWFRFGCFVST